MNFDFSPPYMLILIIFCSFYFKQRIKPQNFININLCTICVKCTIKPIINLASIIGWIDKTLQTRENKKTYSLYWIILQNWYQLIVSEHPLIGLITNPKTLQARLSLKSPATHNAKYPSTTKRTSEIAPFAFYVLRHSGFPN